MNRSKTVFLLSLLFIFPGNSVAYKEKALGPSYSDFGGIGLLQMPTARMAPEGTLGLTANRTSPYSRYAATFQPFPWMEATIRYTSVSGVPFDATGTISDSSYLDKSIDVKFRILEESHYVPELAVGLRDLAGTGLFSSEYIAASKRFGPFDFTLGLGWGYMGTRNHASNPFGFISNSFKTRRDASSSGEFNTINYFRGPIAFFGGVEYQTPHNPLRFKLEYDSNDYSNEPRNAPVAKADTPWNFGLVYRLSKNVDLTLGYERGDEVVFGLSWSNNLKELKSTNKYDIRHQAVINPALVPSAPPSNWGPIVNELKTAGMEVERITLGSKEITIYAEYSKSYHHAELVGLASRILSNRLPANILIFNFVERKQGLSINEIAVRRDYFTSATAGLIKPERLIYNTEQFEAYTKYDPLVYKAPVSKFSYSLLPDLRINYGGPDAAILYQAMASLSASYRFSPSFEISGQVNFGLFDNYDKFVYDAPAGTGDTVPRVRTHIRDYVKGSTSWIENLQLTYTKRLNKNWFAMAYAGLMEMMYGGVGAEVLYRPHGSNLALGFDINHVKLREFERRFGFRDYETLTGHMTAYYHWKKKNVLIMTSVGRYLAKDIGLSLDISRQFKNGVTAGFFATKTDISSADFGEGSFDKGIYITIPFDYLSPFRTDKEGSFKWQPLLRDGGAKLNRKYELYDITRSRDLDRFFAGKDNLVGPVADFK